MDDTVHGILQARILEWVAHSLLQGIFPIQGSNPGLLYFRQMLYLLSHLCFRLPLVISKALTDLGHTAIILRASVVSTLSTKTAQGGFMKADGWPHTRPIK